MSEPKLVSPLLDGFLVGDPMSSHDGISCSPAIRENSDDKYIVKMISNPASQTQLDALLLTGAYKDPADAMEYFKARSEDIVKEAEILQELSKLEGFASFEGWQIDAMDESRLGYRVYLLSPYRRSLERYLRRNPVTHRNAVDMGIDLCSALSLCRSSGYLYVDLRPANIYLTEEGNFQIGDLGFVSLDSLKYASLPAKYLSPYSPPELHDPMATVNTTADVYALGMVLYEIYNNGKLPFEGCAPQEELPSPLNADYEMAEIIMKAVAPDPADRWEDPAQMGQALRAYQQRNGVDDTPIGPPVAVLPQEPEEPTQREATPEEAAPVEDAPEGPEEQAGQEPVPGEDAPEPTPEPQEPTEVGEPEPQAQGTTVIPSVQEEAAAPNGSAEAPDDRQTQVIPPSRMPKKERFKFFEDTEDEEEMEEEAEEDTPELPKESRPRKKKTGLIVTMVVLLVVAALCYGGYYFYRNIYQVTVSALEVSGVDNQISVSVSTDADMSLLTVVCSDSYGNTKRQTLTDGKTLFKDLSPDTMYTIQLEISGFHSLLGSKTGSYTTAAETKITDFVGFTGAVDGSVILEFSVEGPESEWILHYAAEDEEERTLTFSGHRISVSELTVGKTYTFTLEPTTSLYIVTDTSFEYTAQALVLAENLEITACSGGDLTVQWTAPEGTQVESWDVVCYGDGDYRSSVTTTDTTLTFEDIDPAQAYTVEVTAQGMTKYAFTSISANPITVGSLSVDDSDPEKLVFSWEYEGNAPEGGWLMRYSIDGSQEQYVVQCSTESAEVSPRIPGATYTVTILAADSTTTFTTDQTYACPDAEQFSGYAITAGQLKSNLLVTPKSGWSYKDVKAKDYTTSFRPGDSISILLQSPYDFYLDRDDMRILYVIRDGDGNVLTDLTAQQDGVWYDLWFNKTDYHYCELDIPKVPTEAGSYTVDVYFNGYSMCSLNFTIF